MEILISLGVFVTIILLIEGGFYAYHTYLNPKMKQVKRRLRHSGTPIASKVQQETQSIIRQRSKSDLPWLNDLLSRVSRLDPIERLLIQANSQMPLGVFVLLSGLSACVGAIVAAMFNLNLLAMLGSALAGLFLPFLGMRFKRQSRFKEFQRQLPDALDLMARALRAGHAFSVGMKMVGDELPEPIGPEMSRAVEEISFGIDIPEALKNLSTRIECVDLKFFITALIVQRETGGNLAELIESISRLIRLRFELFGRIKALSAEGKMSALVLIVLPFLLLFGLTWINPDYMDPLYSHPTGQAMLAGALIWMGIGAFIMKQMIEIKV